MVEVYNEDSGRVYGDCSCNPSDMTKPALTTKSSIPDWCFSPNGTKCTWYSLCLETRYPCVSTDYSYALRYAEHFCQLQTERWSTFTQRGQQWVDGVRKCLQVTIVPILRRWNAGISCEEISNNVYGSHAVCYSSPGYGAPSMCELTVDDWLKTFWTIRATFSTPPGFSMQGMWNMFSNCKGKAVLKFKREIVFLRLSLTLKQRKCPGKQSLDKYLQKKSVMP